MRNKLLLEVFVKNNNNQKYKIYFRKTFEIIYF